MKPLLFPWMEPAFEALLAMRARLPHALLLTGSERIGKRELARYFAQSLLCESPPPNGYPCGQCGACRWFAEGNHPDYREVVPETLQADPETGAAEEGGAGEATGGKTKAAPSKVIKIGQIRALDGFFNVGTHRAGRRIVLVYPADAMNADASNALLKVLEEPPAATLFLLVTSRPSAVLPTVRSRCARLTVGRPDQRLVLEWLDAQGVREPERALAEAGGAPLAAADVDPAAEYREILLEALSAARPIDPVAMAEKCDKAGAANISLWLSRWTSDLLRCGADGDVRYHPQHVKVLQQVARNAPIDGLFAFQNKLLRMRRVAEHPLNPRLFVEDLLIDYARLAAPRS